MRRPHHTAGGTRISVGDIERRRSAPPSRSSIFSMVAGMQARTGVAFTDEQVRATRIGERDAGCDRPGYAATQVRATRIGERDAGRGTIRHPRLWVRATRIGERDAGSVPEGFSWTWCGRPESGSATQVQESSHHVGSWCGRPESGSATQARDKRIMRGPEGAGDPNRGARRRMLLPPGSFARGAGDPNRGARRRRAARDWPSVWRCGRPESGSATQDVGHVTAFLAVVRPTRIGERDAGRRCFFAFGARVRATRGKKARNQNDERNPKSEVRDGDFVILVSCPNRGARRRSAR